MSVPADKFGVDHWTTFGYLASCVVGRGGAINHDRMRTEPLKHRILLGEITRETRQALGTLWESPPPTRLADGTRVICHDDWDCAGDMEAAGLLVWQLPAPGTKQATVQLTDLGWAVLQRLVEHRQVDTPATFTPHLQEVINRRALAEARHVACRLLLDACRAAEAEIAAWDRQEPRTAAVLRQLQDVIRRVVEQNLPEERRPA